MVLVKHGANKTPPPTPQPIQEKTQVEQTCDGLAQINAVLIEKMVLVKHGANNPTPIPPPTQEKTQAEQTCDGLARGICSRLILYIPHNPAGANKSEGAVA